MKKVLFGLMVFFGGFAFSQDYTDTYPDYYGYEYYDDTNDYPEDYYYNYPTDYYSEDYYQSYYNDYNRSITAVNWNNFFRKFNLSSWQRNEIIMLNNRFASYNVWNMYYGMNPDRWYYDRFFALERILGPSVFRSYQMMYYQNYSPIIYFQNYRKNHYVVHYHVVPKYRYVNVNRYKVYKNDFKKSYQNTRNMAMLDTRSNMPIRSNLIGNDRNKSMIQPVATQDVRSGATRVRNSETIIPRQTVSSANNGTRTRTEIVRSSNEQRDNNNDRVNPTRSSSSVNVINNSSRSTGSRGR